MTKADDHLKRYRGRFWIRKGEDSCWNIQMKRKPREGTTFEISVHSDTHLAACLPPQTARGLLKRFPDAFTLVQDAADAGVLAFEEGRLEELADVLQVRRRRRVSDGERERLRQMGRKHSPFLRDRFPESDERALESTIGAKPASVAVCQPEIGRQSRLGAPKPSWTDQ